MQRDLMRELEKWGSSPRRKPVIVNGARQVGKTWLLKELGRTRFKNVAYVNFDNNTPMKELFEAGYDIPRLLVGIQAETGERIIEGETLVIFDEIQECPKALTSLKYFHEGMPGLHLAAAGSLLGLTIHTGTGYPVGNVTTLDLYPLSFGEFLDATGSGALRDLVASGDVPGISAFASKLAPLLRQYYFVGGMPEAVEAFAREGALSAAREVQRQILSDYQLDMSKHLSPLEVERVLAVWGSIPRHLGRENKKFVFGQIRDGARARDYRSAITWLAQAGLAIPVRRIAKPGIPLAAYAEEAAFKLFLVDVGLLGALSDLTERVVLEGSTIFTEFKGALTEQYVCQQLVSACGLTPYYWSAENTASEVDFVVQYDGEVYPIEVKAEENLRSRSLRAFAERYPATRPLRFSMSKPRVESWMRNIPLYALQNMDLWR